MAKVGIYEPLVAAILREDAIARTDDNYLQYRVCQELNPDILNMSYGEVLLNHNELKKPNEESVGRCRRKIQEKHPELKEPHTTQKRAEREQEFRNYARS